MCTRLHLDASPRICARCKRRGELQMQSLRTFKCGSSSAAAPTCTKQPHLHPTEHILAHRAQPAPSRRAPAAGSSPRPRPPVPAQETTATQPPASPVSKMLPASRPPTSPPEPTQVLPGRQHQHRLQLPSSEEQTQALRAQPARYCGAYMQGRARAQASPLLPTARPPPSWTRLTK